MGLSAALRWWEEWQLRILVLGSLFLQCILFFSREVRTRPILRKFRVLVWITYIGSDALAVYALATLFNRHKPSAADGGSTGLEVIWAPVLLIHLGGLSSITAYSLEDNELWRRHVITVVSQVTVALYVFFKWWSGEKRLLGVAALLFISGIIKFGQKPWALRRASFNSMLDSIAIDPRREVPPPTCWTFWTSPNLGGVLFLRKGGASAAVEEEKQEHHDINLEEYVQQANKYVQDRTDQDEGSTHHIDDIDDIYMFQMFVDVSATYSVRFTKLQSYLMLDQKHAYGLLKVSLWYTFHILYTKARAVDSLLGVCILLFSLPFLALAALVLFAKSHKDGYNEKDVSVTYILLWCNAVVELLPHFILILKSSLRLLPSLQDCFETIVCYLIVCFEMVFHIRYVRGDTVSQYSLLSSVARARKPTVLMELATFSCLRGYINKHWYIGQADASRHITLLVLGYVKDGWKDYIRDAASYRRFSNLRGQWTLHRLRLEQSQRQGLAWSFKMAFDRSVLLWHIATDICFHHPNTSPRGDSTTTQRSREISNYMIYLLFIRPEMLVPGTRPGLFDLASYALEAAFEGSKAPLDKEESLAREIMDIVKNSSGTAPAPGYLIPSACRLAEALMELDDEEKRWQVIQGVWVEMLCYSAARCRGYLHAKSMGEGVEYLSYVWLLWSHMGMETLADKFQKPEEPPEAAEEEIAPPRAPSDSNQTEVEISSPV